MKKIDHRRLFNFTFGGALLGIIFGGIGWGIVSALFFWIYCIKENDKNVDKR